MEIGMTLLGQALSFALLIWFTVKFIWPPLVAAIEERQQRIGEGLAAADRSHRDLARAEEKSEVALKEARAKANEIIDQAHQRAVQLIDAAKHDAVLEAERQKALAQAGIDAATNRAKEDLRRQVSSLVVSGTEKLLRREVDPATHKALLDELAAEI